MPQYESVADLPHRMDRPLNAAVDLLREKIKKHAGEVTLLTIGPLTNVATLLLVDPEIAKSIKRVVSMAGWFHFEPDDKAKGCEWNAACDPVASAVFFTRCTCPLTVVPLDVTLKCAMAREEFERRFSAPPKDVILRMTKEWFKSTDRVIFHDPLACAAAFRPDLCTYRTGSVSAAKEDGFTALGEKGTSRVAETVDAKAFFDEYFGVVG